MSIDAYVYARSPGQAGGPLLFAFHGTGGNENQLMELGRDVAPSATIISPRGDVSEHGAGRFFRRTAARRPRWPRSCAPMSRRRKPTPCAASVIRTARTFLPLCCLPIRICLIVWR